MTTSDQERVIEAMATRIAERFHPDRIVLFGSHARGNATSDSDVDLLVIKPISGSKRQERLAMRSVLRGYGLAKDIVLVTPKEVTRYGHTAGSIIRSALEEGRVLYDSAA